MASPGGLPQPDRLPSPAGPGATALDSAATLLGALLSAPSVQITVLGDQHHALAGRCGPSIEPGSRTDSVLAEGQVVTVAGYLGAPIRGASGRLLGVAEVECDAPRDWTDSEITAAGLFCQTIADHLETVRDLDSRIVDLDLGFDVAGIGTWVWDLRTNTLDWDHRLHSLLGTTPSAIGDIGAFSQMVHPDDRDRVTDALEGAVGGGGDFVEAFRMIRADGAQRWIESRGRAVLDPAGRAARLVGIAYDISESRAATDRLTRVLDAMGSGLLIIAPNKIVSYANLAAQRMLHRSHDELVGAPAAGTLPAGLLAGLYPADGPIGAVEAVAAPIQFAAHIGLGAAGDPDGRWLEATVHPNPDGVAVALGDITEQRRLGELQTASLQAREQAITADAMRQAAQSRFELLASAGEALAPALDLSTALQSSLDVVVPALVDCAIIHLIDPREPSQMRLAAFRHPDPAAAAVLERIFGIWRAQPADADYAGTSAGLGQPLTIDREFLERLSATPQDLADLEALRMSAGVVVPLLARGRMLGTLAIAALGDAAIDTADLTLIEQLATRMAVAIDNARLFHDARAARKTAEAAGAHLALLSEASQSLASTLDVREAVGRLARLVVPGLADWSMVTLLDEDGQPQDIGRWHRDPQMLKLVNAYADVRAASSTPDAPVRQVISTGRPVIIPDVDEAVLNRALDDPAARDLARALDIGSSVELPLVARGRTLGAITLLNDRGRPPLSTDQLAAAREVASRAAVALDNAQTFARQRRVAEELQLSMLTRPPEPDHLQIAVRYLPAAPTAQVGGDWYDAFLDRDGNTVLVIGDVMGHDIAAAAAMGQIRSLVRGIAFDRHESPSQVLARVDEAMAGLAVGALATALLARIEQSDDDAALGVRRITWCSAGHPGPMLITAAGEVQDLVTPAGMLLGVDPTAVRQDSQAVLPVGSTVALFTDGLFERRTMSLDDGLDLVRAALRDLADQPLDTLCDGLLARMLPTAPEDDVALIAMRLFDQGLARPGEAGPREVPRAFDDPDIPAIGTGESAADPQVAQAAFDPDDHAPAQCRRFLEEALDRAFVSRELSAEIRFDLDLVATELVTNALHVAATRISVQVQWHEPSTGPGTAWVRIAVTDDGPGIPELNEAALTDTHGRGLSIVAALATEWGFAQTGPTKTVWARLAV